MENKKNEIFSGLIHQGGPTLSNARIVPEKEKKHQHLTDKPILRISTLLPRYIVGSLFIS